MVSLIDLKFVGKNLHRPECVLVDTNGTLHVADWRGGITMLTRNGDTKSVIAKSTFKPKTNGLALLKNGGWLVTHLGDNAGGVYELSVRGELSPFLLEVDGIPLPPTNYVHIDKLGRVWITVSTRIHPRIKAARPDCDDGFIVLVDDNGARIVADGLGYANECAVHPVTGDLFVNETFGRRLTRFKVEADGSLTGKTTIAIFGIGEFPDGLTFDDRGGIWVTSIVSNRIIRVDAGGNKHVLLEDFDADHVAKLEKAFLAGKLNSKLIEGGPTKVLRNISSLAFGGPDLKTVYLGCLLGSNVAVFRSDIAGLRPAHAEPGTKG